MSSPREEKRKHGAIPYHVLAAIQNQDEKELKAVLEKLQSLRPRGDFVKHVLEDGIPIHLNKGLLVFPGPEEQLADGLDDVKLPNRGQGSFTQNLGEG